MGNDRETISVKLPKTPSGKIRRYCPNEGCKPRNFLLGDAAREFGKKNRKPASARRKPQTDGMTCPYCGSDEADDEFTHPQDLEYALNVVREKVASDAHKMLSDTARHFNRNSKGGMISASMEVKRRHRTLPNKYREDLLRNITCSICTRQYGVYALALFCPDCGSPNILDHFDRESEIVKQQLQLAQQARDDGNVELSYRLIANADEDVVSAMEAIFRAVFRQCAPSEDQTGLSMQNFNRASEAFQTIGIDLHQRLEPGQIERIKWNIQRRHLVGHNLGLADKKFVALKDAMRFGAPAVEGQTITIKPGSVEEFITDIGEIVATLNSSLRDNYG